ncbi:hypothetical protein HK101_009562, partial [Irineochytrium annulatum]
MGSQLSRAPAARDAEAGGADAIQLRVNTTGTTAVAGFARRAVVWGGLTNPGRPPVLIDQNPVLHPPAVRGVLTSSLSSCLPGHHRVADTVAIPQPALMLIPTAAPAASGASPNGTHHNGPSVFWPELVVDDFGQIRGRGGHDASTTAGGVVADEERALGDARAGLTEGRAWISDDMMKKIKPLLKKEVRLLFSPRLRKVLTMRAQVHPNGDTPPRRTQALQCFVNLQKSTLRLRPVELTGSAADSQHRLPPSNVAPPATPAGGATLLAASPLLEDDDDGSRSTMHAGTRFKLEFAFDASSACVVTLHWVAKEMFMAVGKLGVRSVFVAKDAADARAGEAKTPTMEEVAGVMSFGPFKAGLNRKFELPDDCLFDPQDFNAPDLILHDFMDPKNATSPAGANATSPVKHRYPPGSNPMLPHEIYYPLIIHIESVNDDGSPLADGCLNTQSTFATLVPGKDGRSYEVRIVKQKIS